MASSKPEPEYDAGHVPITEEFDDAKHSLPPIAPVAIALLAVALVVAALAFFLKQAPAAAGSINNMIAIDVPNQNRTLCSIQISVQNKFKKPIVVHGIYATLHTPDQGDLSDNQAPASDVPRYVAAFPALKDSTTDPIRPDTIIQPGASANGSVVVAFPVTKDKFDARKGLTVVVELYDHADLKLEK